MNCIFILLLLLCCNGNNNDCDHSCHNKPCKHPEEKPCGCPRPMPEPPCGCPVRQEPPCATPIRQDCGCPTRNFNQFSTPGNTCGCEEKPV